MLRLTVLDKKIFLDELFADSAFHYFDIMNFADKIKTHMLLDVGLQDSVCPPSSVYAVYNNMKCKKEIDVYKYAIHEWLNPHKEKCLEWIARNL